jgi:hypothetical protein
MSSRFRTALWSPRTTALVGLVGGIVVTARAHRHPSSPGWIEPVGGTRLRRVDLPLVGTLSFLASILLRRSGKSDAARAVLGLAIGSTVGAVGTGLAEPLPAS